MRTQITVGPVGRFRLKLAMTPASIADKENARENRVTSEKLRASRIAERVGIVMSPPTRSAPTDWMAKPIIRAVAMVVMSPSFV